MDNDKVFFEYTTNKTNIRTIVVDWFISPNGFDHFGRYWHLIACSGTGCPRFVEPILSPRLYKSIFYEE